MLREFNHRCAICANDKPQLHHIDTDPSNNDPMNLVPLCPNCHLSDQHNPTRGLDQDKLSLFRRFKDPYILKPQFHPLFIRTRFLDEIDSTSADELDNKAGELVEFVANLEMGEFYGKRIKELTTGVGLRRLPIPIVSNYDEERRRASMAANDRSIEKARDEYREKLRSNKDAVLALIIELLRFQAWEGPTTRRDA